ncbi:tail fiber protein [Escherichia coli]|nr:tail fiber protein [Escherichia coli]EIZ3924030.1 tail fiber protein [Escherichia coli]
MGADKTNNIMTLSSGVSQPLLADVQYFELYSSLALNRKLKNIVLPGFYCGFEPVPGTGLSVRITSENSEGKGTASVDVNNVQISVQQIEDVTVSVKAGATNIIVLEANFEHGVKTTQVDSASSVSAARIYARTDNTIGQNQIELCRVIVPSGATAVTKEMIVLKYRVNRAVGVEFSNEISSTEERKAATPLAVKTLHDLVDTKAPINSPNLTGTPTAPTATKGTNNTQIASTAFVMAAIAALVDSSPDALNTLNELAAALGNDPNFATTVIDALAGKQPKDATLTALAELATSADKLPYFTGANRAALTALTSVGREIISKTSTEDVLDYLRLTEIIDKFHSQITTCERNSRVENFYTLAETCTAELLSLNAPEAYDKSITLTVNEELTTDYTGPVTGHCSIGDPQSYTIAMCTSTTLEYQVSSVVLESDGTFSFARSWPGAKAFKLYRTSNNGLVTVREDPLCIRSYRMPSDAGDETVRVMKDRTYTYDQAVSAIALMAQGHSQTERFVRGLCAIVGSGGSEGSVPFFVNRMSAQTSSQYYRTGNAAWVAYALAYYLLKYPDGEMAVVARDKLTQCAEWIEMFRVRDGSDVRSGLYTSGSGQYLNGVFYPDFDADWCASEHQFDLWFLFDLMGRLGFTGYAEKAKALADAIMEKLWVEDEGRFYAGMRTTGVDKASPLDCASWGGLFVANIDMEKARRCFTYLGRLWYATHDATGYTPYHPEYGYPNKQRGVWVEGSAGVALLARRLGDDTTAMDILARLAPLRTRYGYIDSCDYPDNDDMPPWPSSCNTAWMILACDPQGFWNVNSPVLPGRYYKY